MGSVVEEGEVLANMTLSMFTLADLMNHPWSYGGTKFWMVLMFAPLAFMFVTAYIVHIIHVGSHTLLLCDPHQPALPSRLLTLPCRL